MVQTAPGLGRLKIIDNLLRFMQSVNLKFTASQ